MAKNAATPTTDDKDLQLEAEPMGKGWKILTIAIAAVIAIAIIAMVIILVTHPA